ERRPRPRAATRLRRASTEPLPERALEESRDPAGVLRTIVWHAARQEPFARHLLGGASARGQPARLRVDVVLLDAFRALPGGRRRLAAVPRGDHPAPHGRGEATTGSCRAQRARM